MPGEVRHGAGHDETTMKRKHHVADGEIPYQGLLDLRLGTLAAPRDAGLEDDEEAVVNQALAIIARRLRVSATSMHRPQDVENYLKLQLATAERELFAVMLLDNRHRLIDFRILHAGTHDGAEVQPREIARAALAVNATAVILAHNHPSQVADPSAADRAVTARAKQALDLIDVRLLEHIVIGRGGADVASFAARGWL